MPGIMPFMPRIIFCRLPPFIFFIMLAHLLVLVQQAVDFLHLHARARGDAALARGLDQLGLARAPAASSS